MLNLPDSTVMLMLSHLELVSLGLSVSSAYILVVVLRVRKWRG